MGWLELARAEGEKREKAEALCELLLIWLRDVAVAQAGGAGLALPDLAPVTRSAAVAVSPAEALRRRDEVRRTIAGLRQNGQPVLALERLFIGWFHGRS
jgi:DNA polymerase-3 subunit delta'